MYACQDFDVKPYSDFQYITSPEANVQSMCNKSSLIMTVRWFLLVGHLMNDEICNVDFISIDQEDFGSLIVIERLMNLYHPRDVLNNTST